MGQTGGRVVVEFRVTVEKISKNNLNAEKVEYQLNYIGNSVLRKSPRWKVEIPKNLQTRTTKPGGGYRYTAVIKVSRAGRNEESIRAAWLGAQEKIDWAAKKQRWALLSDEALVPSGDEYVVVNGAGEPTGDPAPRLLTDVVRTGLELPPLTDSILAKYFSRIYDRDSHIRGIYDQLKLACKTAFKTRHHILLKGPPACISGDAIVELNRTGGSFKITLASLYRRFNGISEGEHGNAKWDKKFTTKIRARSSDGCIRLFDIAGVVDSGVKETVQVVTESGKSVRATSDHRFLTDEGWKPLSQIKEGDKISVDGGPAKASGRKWSRRNYFEKHGMVHHPFATRRSSGRCTVRVHRLVVEAERNGLSFPEYVSRLRSGNIDGLVFLDPAAVVHHEDTDTANNTPENLSVKVRSDHSREHARTDKISQRFVAATRFEAVVKIHDPKMEQVYDVQLATEPHNFLAGGIVVHNCAKSELFLCFIDWLGSELIEPMDATTLTKAGLETQLLNASRCGTLKPILLLEEIEKCHPDNLSCLLQIMDGRGKIQRTNARDGNVSADCNIIIWATCNSEDLLRKFHDGAIYSRFSVQQECKRPDRALMRRILVREVNEIDGDEKWVDPVLDFCFGELAKEKRFAARFDDPRLARSLLAGGERLLDGSAFDDCRKVFGLTADNPEKEKESV